jgi:hypothetical protein
MLLSKKDILLFTIRGMLCLVGGVAAIVALAIGLAVFVDILDSMAGRYDHSPVASAILAAVTAGCIGVGTAYLARKQDRNASTVSCSMNTDDLYERLSVDLIDCMSIQSADIKQDMFVDLAAKYSRDAALWGSDSLLFYICYFRDIKSSKVSNEELLYTCEKLLLKIREARGYGKTYLQRGHLLTLFQGRSVKRLKYDSRQTTRNLIRW